MSVHAQQQAMMPAVSPADLDGGLSAQQQAHHQQPAQSKQQMQSNEEESDNDGVWSKDIEDAFEEALHIYPPCGRRKIILSNEGKMYGRNELIARYIQMRTGKVRSRKQVSSHIQVLARKKQREEANKLKEATSNGMAGGADLGPGSGGPFVPGMPGDFSGYSGYQPAHGSQSQRHHAMSFGGFGSGAREAQGGDLVRGRPLSYSQDGGAGLFSDPAMAGMAADNMLPMPTLGHQAPSGPIYHHGHTLRIALDYLSAFVEFSDGGMHELISMSGSAVFAESGMELIDIGQIADKVPLLPQLYAQGPPHAFFVVKHWGDLNYNRNLAMAKPSIGQQAATFAFSCRFESLESFAMECSTSIVSLGKTVVRKTQVAEAVPESGRFVYNLNRAPLCPYIVTFIDKLVSLGSTETMNRVLENFMVVQEVRHNATKELLFCTVYAFEAAPHGRLPRHNVYKLVDGFDDPARRYTA